MALRIAMVVPPSSDLTGPYSSAPRLVGWLRAAGHEVELIDLSLELFLRVYSKAGLTRLFAAIDPRKLVLDLEDVYRNRDRYIRIIDQVIAFVQGRDQTLTHRIVRGDFLPEGPQFRGEKAENRDAAFGEWGTTDHARFLVSLMLQDLAELFKQTITEHFGLVNYGSRLGEARSSFDEVHEELTRPTNEIEKLLVELATERLDDRLDLVCLTCPFPGNLFGSLFLGKWLGEHRPGVKRALGGGYPSTELRDLQDARVFDYVDYMVLDDGEVPLQQICARIAGEDVPLERTFVREDGRVVYRTDSSCKAPAFRDLPAPDYQGVQFDRYISVIYRRNRISRLLSEGVWLKLTAAHGCYWKKCTFCDIHLPYIGEFDPNSAAGLADQMDAMHEQTGLSGFHFTDEAAPPALLVKLAMELLRRGRSYQFWGNIRYDTAFTADRCRLLAAAGMVAVTGGIEIASDELLPKINKGITVAHVINVLRAFSQAGVLTHAYLIQGFPGETAQDTTNSLEIMRQLMKAQLLRSAYYHEFVPTTHSPVGRNPELYGIKILGPKFGGFANYALQYQLDTPGPRGTELYLHLQKAVEAFARGDGLDRDILSWLRGYDFPPPQIPADFVDKAVQAAAHDEKQYRHLCWLGGTPSWERGLLTVGCLDGEVLSVRSSRTVADNLARAHPAGWGGSAPPLLADFETTEWTTPFRSRGLVLV